MSYLSPSTFEVGANYLWPTGEYLRKIESMTGDRLTWSNSYDCGECSKKYFAQHILRKATLKEVTDFNCRCKVIKRLVE